MITILTIISVSAQKNIICGHDLYTNQLENRYPGFKESVSKTFFDLQTHNTQQKMTSISNTTINVVVHVVWNNIIENIHDSIIQSQIDVLNEDFNRLNGDSTNLRNLFQPIAGNAHITFNLYQIKRTHTDSLFDPSQGGIPITMKYDSLGGSTAVDPIHFLNIWICKIQPLSIFGTPFAQILGFAFPPANLSNWPSSYVAPPVGEDGVVIDYRCVGRNNPYTLSIPFSTILLVSRGRTPVHEVGHYLGLRHIWGDGGNGSGGGNNCQGDDGIADTPNANDQSQFDCNTSKNTCVDIALPWTSLDAPDMVENFMDYSNETCMNTFTIGQVTHMQNVLTGPRAGLLQPLGITESTLKNTVLVFPNPVDDIVQIHSSTQKIKNIEIFDLTGHLVFQAPFFTDYVLEINTSKFANGVYTLTLTLENNSNISKKIIVVH